MKYRKLADTGTSVSNLALGAMDFGSKTGDTEAFAILDRFIEAGGNLVDTANVYGGGESEKLLGRWFADRPADVTDRVVLATKARFGTGLTSTKMGRPVATWTVPDGVPASPRPGKSRPLPAARVGPADPDRRDASLSRRRRSRRQDQLYRPVKLHRLADAADPLDRCGIGPAIP